MQIKLPLIGDVLIGRVKNSAENDPSYNRWAAALGAYADGKTPVTVDTAIQVATVIRCVDVVAKNIATLPLNLYRATATGAEKAKNDGRYSLLHSLPNPETTAYDFWLMYVYNLMLTEGAYAYIQRDRSGFPVALYNMPSCKCRMRRNKETGERYVEYQTDTGVRNIYPENLMYTPGARLSDTDNPLDPITLAGRVLGLTNALNDFAQTYFDNGANGGAVVNVKSAKGETSFKQFVKDFNAQYEGVSRANKTMFLPGDAEFIKLKNNPNESQALESRQAQVYEICRVMGVTPFKVFEYGRATYGNMEQVNIEFVQETINPMAVRIEQTIMRDLLLPYERGAMYAKFNLYGLLRGDTAAQTAHFNMLRQNGIKNANEIRELMDENRIPVEEGGDAYLVNGNMISLKTAMSQQPKQTGTAPAN